MALIVTFFLTESRNLSVFKHQNITNSPNSFQKYLGFLNNFIKTFQNLKQIIIML